jgi:hypothetical protein
MPLILADEERRIHQRQSAVPHASPAPNPHRSRLFPRWTRP